MKLQLFGYPGSGILCYFRMALDIVQQQVISM